MNIVGISAFFHDASCCLLQDGQLVAAASEERFSRIKHDARLPVQAFQFCLQRAGITAADLHSVAYYESPPKKLSRQLWAGIRSRGWEEIAWLDPRRPEWVIREKLGYEGPIELFDHHQSHGAGAFFCSGFDEAAILTVDGVGEWATMTYGRGAGREMEIFEEIEYPHSLGLLYSTLTAYLGFRVNRDEYKVMGLSPLGEPRLVEQVRELVRGESGGSLRLNMAYFDFRAGDRMYSERLCDLFGHPARIPGSPILPFHRDLARSLQLVLEEILLDKVLYLAETVESRNLCLAGGVALNCVANARILREGPYERLFVQPASGDAGGCLGAAILAHLRLEGERPTRSALTDVSLGPSYSSEEIKDLLASTCLDFLDYRGQESRLLEAAVDLLEQKKVIGWFHGAMEFGPRALGNRSILANPMDPGVKDRLNLRIKGREDFQPFAPSVLLEHSRDHFDLDHPSPFMLETCQVVSRLDLPAITHLDGSARPQTVDRQSAPRFAGLLETFYRRTGCPLLLNTSFNIAGEPIVCDPSHALLTAISADLDALVLEDFLITREMIPKAIADIRRASRPAPDGFTAGQGPEVDNLYTFV